MKINGKRSMVVCINGDMKERSWHFGGCEIGEVEEYTYLGATLKQILIVALKVWRTTWWMQTEYMVW